MVCATLAATKTVVSPAVMVTGAAGEIGDRAGGKGKAKAGDGDGMFLFHIRTDVIRMTDFGRVETARAKARCRFRLRNGRRAGRSGF